MLRLFHAASYAGRFDHPRSVSRKPKHAAGLSKLALPSQSSAALSAGLRISSETPGGRILGSSPASFAGTTGFDLRREGNSAVRREAGLDFGTTCTRGWHHRAILNRAAKGAALLSDDAPFAGVNSDGLAACCVSTASQFIQAVRW